MKTRRDPGFTLPVLYVRHIADQLRSMGVDEAAWLGRCGLVRARLDDPTLVVHYEDFEALVTQAIELAHEPALGLFVGERLVAATHGVLGFAAMSSGSLRQALEVFERFSQLRISIVAVSHVIVAREVHVRFTETRPLGPIRRPLFEAIMLSIKNVIDAISMGACRVLRAAFPGDPPDHAALAGELFGCEVAYGQPWAGLVLPSDALDVPLKLADPEAFAEAARICERELAKLTANESTSAKVRRILLDRQQGFPSREVTARLVHLGARTLHRRLRDEGTSYGELLDEVRHTLAVEHLAAGRFTIEEVAWKLGYSDLANFRRAFKRWESVPPGAFRRARDP